MENNKLSDKAQELKQDFNQKKEQVIDKAKELKNDIREKKDAFVDKVKSTVGGSKCSSTCHNQSGNWQQHDKQQPNGATSSNNGSHQQPDNNPTQQNKSGN